MRIDDLSLGAHADARADRYLDEARDRVVMMTMLRSLRLAAATTLVRIAVWMAPAELLVIPATTATAPNPSGELTAKGHLTRA